MIFRCIKLKQYITLVSFLLVHFISFAQGKIIMNGATIRGVNGVYIVTKKVSLTSTSALSVNNSTIKIGDSIINNAGIFDVTTGTVELNGTSPQIIPANAFYTNKIRNLVISNNVTLAGEDSITNVLSFGSSFKNFETGGFLTLKSDLSNTARIADITNGGVNSGNGFSGNVKVERYINSSRGWRLLTAPISPAGAQTINAAWQEGVANPTITYANNLNPVPGFGVQIPGGATNLGFDKGINANASLKIFKPTTGTWVGIASTNKPITDSAGYMLFIRGNRSTNLSQGVNAALTSTVLRTTGQLKTNDQSFGVQARGFTLIGNPYAAPINLNQLAKLNSTNIQDIFYLWDPKITGTAGSVGGYVAVSWNGSGYDVVPPSPSGINQYVQSGSAFFVKTRDSTKTGTLVIKETDKSGTRSANANRPNSAMATLRTNLYSIGADSSISIDDGVLNSYGDAYSNDIDDYDAIKIKNISESLSSIREGKSLVIERKQPIGAADTIFLHMLQMKVMYYQFELIADNFNNNGLLGFLEDSYFNTSTPIDLQGTTIFKFNVINVPGSWNPGRFQIVFKQAAVLPVTFSVVRAFAQNNNIKVEWKVENETNIKQYDVEKSGDGQQFVKVNTVKAKGNSSVANYDWLDVNAFKGNNYYRIKSTGIDGGIKYSSVMKVNIGKDKPEIILATNVISNNTITFQMNNMPKGSYAVNITNNLGQLMHAQKIEHGGGSSTENIRLTNNFANGIYHLTIITPDFISLTMKLLIQ